MFVTIKFNVVAYVASSDELLLWKCLEDDNLPLNVQKPYISKEKVYVVQLHQKDHFNIMFSK
jgi:hypothetical protein